MLWHGQILLRTAAALLALVLPLAARADQVVLGSGLRVRAAPSATADVVARVSFGTVLACSERSAPAQIDGKPGAFCRTKLATGEEGWFFEPLTAPAEADLDAQLTRLAAAKMAELKDTGDQRTADLYDLQRFLQRRIDEATDRPHKLAARLVELRLVEARPDMFQGDKARIYQDDSQGPRLKREVIEKLIADADGTPVAEEAAWFLVGHGMDFECEGEAACDLSWLVQLECGYLNRFPAGPHAAEAVKSIADVAAGTAQEPPDIQGDPPAPATLVALRACLRKTKAGDVKTALAAIDKLAHRPAAK